MENYYQMGIIFATLIVVRFLLYISKYFYLDKVLKKQDVFIRGSFDESSENMKQKSGKAGDWVQANQIEIKKVVLKAGIQDAKKSYMEPLGLGYTQKQTISALDNLLLLNAEIMGSSIEIIKRARGYYKIQALKSFNPLFWIEFLIFLPKELFKYFGVDEEAKAGSIIIKVFQIIYWIASIIYMYQTYLYNNQ